MVTMGYENRGRKIQKFLKNKAGLIAVLLLVFSGYLGVKFWNARTANSTVAEAAISSAELFDQVEVDRRWILIGDEFTADQKSIEFAVRISSEFSGSDFRLEYAVANTAINGKLAATADPQRFAARIAVNHLPAGEYSIRATAISAAGDFVSAPVEFTVSYPLYVAWTLDWEGYDVSQNYLNDLAGISEKYGVPITHFFNPRIYTSSAITPARAQYLTDWAKNRREQGDAIGLHLHMFPDLVRATGVEPRFEPNWGSTLKDGYDILTSAYTYGETVKLLEWSKDIFKEKGLGIPTMFRAGGWFADEETLQALNDTGFGLDSSGRTKYAFGENSVTGPWDLAATTHPYRLNAADQNITDSPTLGLWEFPDNGADSWAYSAEQLIARFKDNFNGAPLVRKQVVTYLSHPEWFAKDRPKLEILFQELSRFAYSADSGPVIYITLEQADQIWAGR